MSTICRYALLAWFTLLALGMTGCAPSAETTVSTSYAPPKQIPAPKQPLPAPAKRRVNPAKMEQADAYWRRAQQEIYRSPEELVAQDAREKRRGQVLPKLTRGNPARKLIALTFDDGPHPSLTPQLLEILKKASIRATFFVVGKMVEKSPDLLRAINDAGHEIGNHTFSHVTLTKIPLADIETEYRANNDIVLKTIGKTMTLCRPPGGDYDDQVIAGALEVGLTTVLWTDDPGDYATPGSEVIQKRTLDKLSNGAIILLHDGISQTLAVLPQIISYAKKQGFEFVTVSELRASLAER